jgi:hypothetical protein
MRTVPDTEKTLASGGTMIVVSYSSMIIGPCRGFAVRSLRLATGVAIQPLSGPK